MHFSFNSPTKRWDHRTHSHHHHKCTVLFILSTVYHVALCIVYCVMSISAAHDVVAVAVLLKCNPDVILHLPSENTHAALLFFCPLNHAQVIFFGTSLRLLFPFVTFLSQVTTLLVSYIIRFPNTPTNPSLSTTTKLVSCFTGYEYIKCCFSAYAACYAHTSTIPVFFTVHAAHLLLSMLQSVLVECVTGGRSRRPRKHVKQSVFGAEAAMYIASSL